MSEKHSTIEKWWTGYRCDATDLVSLDMNGRYPVRLQAPLKAAGVALSAAIMDNGYRQGMGPTGSYNCRKIAWTNTWSLHAYAIAVDWDYGSNPYIRGGAVDPGFGIDGRFQLTEAQVNAVEAIRNSEGGQIWVWKGWDLGDYMHFQVNVPPDKCQPVEDTVPTYRDVDNVPLEDWAESVIDWGIDNGLIITTDEHQDDWLKNVDYGRLWTLLMRMDTRFH